MTEYHLYGLTLSNAQVSKIIKAAKNHSSVKIRVVKDRLRGDHKLPLTQTQINRINKSKRGLDLTLSHDQIKHIENRERGCLRICW